MKEKYKSTQHIFVGSSEEFGNFRLNQNGLERVSGGLHWFVAALFLLADMAGGGIVAMPNAIVHSSFYVGLFILFLMATMATISSILLGKAWLIMLRRFPLYRTHCRKPYAEMGFRAIGPITMRVASGCVNFTQFGASVVFLLLSAKNLNEFLSTAFDVKIGFCSMIIILALFLFPATLLKSPQDFWPSIIFGMLSTFVAVILVCYGAMNDQGCTVEQTWPTFDLKNAFTYLGTVLFSFGGHSAFPTIQVDMTRPADFDKSTYLGFTVITIVNVLVVLFGGLTYAGSVGNSVINSIQTLWVRQAINVMIAAHCLLTVTLIINPLNQEFEEHLKIPHGFSIKRVLVRGGLIALVAFIAETLPSFGSVMDIMGGSTVTLTSLVFPCLFYLYLSASEKQFHELTDNENSENKNEEVSVKSDSNKMQRISFFGVIQRTNKAILFMCIFICVVGTLSGIVATIAAIKALFDSEFVSPCYFDIFQNKKLQTSTALRCCGPFQNISLFGEACFAPV